MQDTGIKLKFRGENLLLFKGEYAEPPNTALQLVCETGEPFMTASVNIDEVGPGQVAIKNYSENEGVMDALIEAGVISQPLFWEQSGFVRIPVCALKI